MSRTDAVTHFMRNAWEPIAVPRWMISAKYAAFFVVGVIAFFDGIETLNLATPMGYEPVWALVVGCSGIIAFTGSLRPKWGWVEAVGASYATECPGGMNLDGVTRRAQELLNGDDMPRYLEWSDDDKNWLAWDVLNKPVIENAFGHTVSIAAIVNGIEKRLADQTPTQTVATVDAGQVAAALAADPGFIGAIAKAVNDDAATRLAQ